MSDVLLSSKQIGGKARNTLLMQNMGIPTPASYVIKDSFFKKFIQHNRLQHKISQLQNPNTSAQQAFNLAQQLQSDILAGEIPIKDWQNIYQEIRTKITEKHYIVRSSALGEDAQNHSFAGQLNSIKADDLPETLINSIKKCWCSLFSEHCITYQRQSGYRLEGMGLLIQNWINAEISGVLFTQSPDHFDKADSMLVEYCYGSAEHIVAGTVTPGRWYYHKSNRQIDVTEQAKDDDSDRILKGTEDWIKTLLEYAHKLEHKMECPQDIEWTLGNDRQLYILQSRPITTQQLPSEIWSNANVNENYPEPVTPVLFSIAQRSYYHYFLELGKAFGVPAKKLHQLEPHLQNIIGPQASRIYYNLTNIHACLKDLPLGKLIVRDWNDFVGVSHVDSSKTTTQRLWRSTQQVFIAIQMGLKILPHLFGLSSRIERFVKRIENFILRSNMTLSQSKTIPVEHYLEHFKCFLDIRFNRWTSASLADAASMFSHGALKRFHTKHLRHTAIQFERLLQGPSQIISGQPAQALWELAQLYKSNDADFKRQREVFLDDWGFRCSGELMLSVKNFRDNKEDLQKIILSYIKQNVSEPNRIFHQQASQATKEIAQAKSQLGLIQGWIFSQLIRYTHKAIANREKARLAQGKLYGQLRLILLDLGKTWFKAGILPSSESIFFLTYSEIIQHPTPNQKLTQTIVKRQQELQQHLALMPPEHMTLKRGQFFESLDKKQQQALYELSVIRSTTSPHGKILQGQTVCPGIIKGKVRIVDNIQKAYLIQKGDILVTQQTDPGWVTIFPLITGLIMVRGGVLSHGAIVAREFGIPAMVEVKNAMEQLQSGQLILLDATQGIIREIHH